MFCMDVDGTKGRADMFVNGCLSVNLGGLCSKPYQRNCANETYLNSDTSPAKSSTSP